MPKTKDPILFEGVQIMYRNMEGRPGDYNSEGDRNFCIELDEENAAKLFDEGYNVKVKVRDDGSQTAYVKVKATFGGRHPDPRVVLISRRGRAGLPEHLVELVDGVDIEYCDVYITPFDWKKGGNSGRSAYLKSLAIILMEDPLEEKYAHLEDISPQSRPAIEPRTEERLALPAGDDGIVDAVIVED